MERPLPDNILRLDYRAWFHINVEWRNAVLDFVMPFLRNQFFWAPVYLFLLVFMLYNFRLRGLYWCMAFIITFALCDYSCAGILKPYFQRIRPCNNPYLQQFAYLIVPRSSGYSLPSNHACNHFGLSIFIAATLGRRFGRVWLPALLWAFAVSYAQVYVGVHFPVDVACGALLGSFWGIMMARIFNKTVPLFPADDTVNTNDAVIA